MTAPAPRPPQMRVADTVVVRLTPAEAVALVDQHGARPQQRPLALCSANLDHLHHFGAGRDRLGDNVNWITLADGSPISRRGSQLTGTRWPRVTGADLLPAILQLCADRGYSVGFVGGTTQAHLALASAITAGFPQLRVTGFWAPTRAELSDADANTRMVAQIAAARTVVLVVALGKPRQEQWIDAWGPRTRAAVLLPFGAATDFLAGTVHRAPEFWRRAGLEWMYRLWREPRRLARRYLVQGPPALWQLRSARLVTSAEAPEPGALP